MSRRVTKTFYRFLVDTFSKSICEMSFLIHPGRVGELLITVRPSGKDGETLDFLVSEESIECVTKHADDCKCGVCVEVCKCGHDQSEHKRVPAQGPDRPAFEICCADKFCFCYKYVVAK